MKKLKTKARSSLRLGRVDPMIIKEGMSAETIEKIERAKLVSQRVTKNQSSKLNTRSWMPQLSIAAGWWEQH